MSEFLLRMAFLMIYPVLPIASVLYLVRASAERVIGVPLRWRPRKTIRRERQYYLVLVVAGSVFSSYFQSYCFDCPSPRLFMLSQSCAFTAVTGWLVYFFVWLLSRRASHPLTTGKQFVSSSVTQRPFH